MSSPPNAKFTGGSGHWMVPMCSPEGVNTQMPPGPVANTLPLLSFVR